MKANLFPDKASQDTHTVPMESTTATGSSRLSKKHVLIAVVSLLAVVLVVVCVLVAIRIYTDSQKEIFKYSVTSKDANNQPINQTVSVADNSVIYHVVQNGIECWVVNDFDKNLQVIKAKTGEGVKCYVTPLDRSLAEKPDAIPSTAPVDRPKENRTINLSVLPDEISDVTFLGSKAASTCRNIPTYWQVPSCYKAAGRMKRRVHFLLEIGNFRLEVSW